MGNSLRIGLDPAEHTALVTTGPFRWVRNPIYTAMVTYLAAMVLLIPNPASIAAVAVLFIAEEFQVRRVEEPYLKTVHGDTYMGYGARVGRFVPCFGRL